MALAVCPLALATAQRHIDPTTKRLSPNASRPISFVNDVVPVLTRAGCNAGTCHGAAVGKNGFKLSLRGYAPELDHFALTHQSLGRRVSRTSPEQSLLLRKPLMELPHMGGMAIRRGSPEHEIFTRWLAAGAPGPVRNDPHVTRIAVDPSNAIVAPRANLSLKVRASFSDGSSRDVTHWSRFVTNDENVALAAPDGAVSMTGYGETSIMIGYQDRVAVARVTTPYPNRISRSEMQRLPRSNFIDDHVYTKLADLNLWPSSQASDAEFVRRIYIDLIGTLPSPDDVRSFASNRDGSKREKLIDALMQKPEFVDFWTYKWCDLLRVNRGTLKDKGMWAFYSYVHESVRENRPWDRIAREVLTSTGNTFLDGPANYFRTALKPEELAENVSQGFLGIRVGCAKCHNHPLEKWTQNEYYGMANIFARTKFKANLAIYVNDEMTVYNEPTGDLIQPRLGKAIPPKPLGGPVMATDTGDRRTFFANWLTRPDNWYFSHTIVNRVWAHFMGRGLVEPVDDLRETNPPTNPALFDALAADFVKHGFDLRALMRTIVMSQAYQRSSATNPRNIQDNRYYSRYLVRRLTAEEIMDALSQVTGKTEQFPGLPAGFRAIQLPDTHVKSDFMDSFGRPPRQITCECERSQEPSMAQALLFINGDLINQKVTANDGIVDRLVKAGGTDEQVVEGLYWTALGRAPKPAERVKNLAAIESANAEACVLAPIGWVSSALRPPEQMRRRRALEDMLWVLVSSKEFLFNH